MTVRDYISEALQLLGVIASGETASAADEADGLSALVRMLSRWSTEGLLIYTKTKETFTLVASQQTYTWGAAGDFNSARPVLINEVNILVNDVEYQVEIINEQQWASIPNKSFSSDIPRFLFAEGSYPLERINLWPKPSSSNSLVVYSKKPLTTYSSVNDTVTVPPGYEDAIIYNLAIARRAAYGAPLEADVYDDAKMFLANLKRKNHKANLLKPDTAGLTTRRTYNIYKGV
jgi:hypothetical protein